MFFIVSKKIRKILLAKIKKLFMLVIGEGELSFLYGK